MTHERQIGRYLAQGWGANAVATYLLWLGLFLVVGDDGWGVAVLIAVPFSCFIVGLFGLATGAGLWILEYVTDRKLKFWVRALAGIFLPCAFAVLVALLCGFLPELIGVLGVTIMFAILILPAALLSGSRVNPLNFVVMDLHQNLPKFGWARALSIIAVPLLRALSAVAVLEALIYLACRRSVLLGSWDVADKQFSGGIIAVVYFAITLIVSLCLPDKVVVVACGLVANAPIVAFALSRHPSFVSQFFAVVGWIFVLLWTLFLVSQLLRSETRRLIPLTMLEIRIRHALNYW